MWTQESVHAWSLASLSGYALKVILKITSNETFFLSCFRKIGFSQSRSTNLMTFYLCGWLIDFEENEIAMLICCYKVTFNKL